MKLAYLQTLALMRDKFQQDAIDEEADELNGRMEHDAAMVASALKPFDALHDNADSVSAPPVDSCADRESQGKLRRLLYPWRDHSRARTQRT